MKKTLIIFLLLFAFNSLVMSQCEEVYLKGQVIDTTSHIGFYNLMVINMTTKQGVFGHPDGKFSVYVRPGDKIAFSVKGYGKIFINIPSQLEECSVDTLIYLTPNVQNYEEITIYPVRSLEDIKKDRESLSQRETRTVTGLNVISSPITALYERFSKRAKSKKLVAQMEYQDDINQVLKELLRAYVSYDVVYLKEDQFESFVYFLNIDENFLKTATDYELIEYIKGKLEHYKSMHPEIFKR